MNKTFFSLAIAVLAATRLFAGTPEQEKAFVDGYKAAFEAGDKAKLEAYLYTQGANPMALEFYKMMQTNDAGQKVVKIELINLTAEDTAKAEEVYGWSRRTEDEALA